MKLCSYRWYDITDIRYSDARAGKKRTRVSDLNKSGNEASFWLSYWLSAGLPLAIRWLPYLLLLFYCTWFTTFSRFLFRILPWSQIFQISLIHFIKSKKSNNKLEFGEIKLFGSILVIGVIMGVTSRLCITTLSRVSIGTFDRCTAVCGHIK